MAHQATTATFGFTAKYDDTNSRGYNNSQGEQNPKYDPSNCGFIAEIRDSSKLDNLTNVHTRKTLRQ